MSSVAIHKEDSFEEGPRFKAVGGTHVSFGRTAGEALDNLNAENGHSESLVLVQQLLPDEHFTDAQFKRMRELLERRELLTESEHYELNTLVKTELVASTMRTKALADLLGR